MFTIEGSPGAETPLAILLGGIYLMPLVCLITFIVSSIFQREWIRNNIKKAILFIVFLVGWIFITLYHLKSLTSGTILDYLP